MSHHHRASITAAVLLALTGCASIPPEDIVPTNVFFQKAPDEVQGILVDACASAGNQIVSQTPNTVVCEMQLSGGQAFIASLAIGNAYSTTPVAQLAMTIAPQNGGTRVYWQTFLQTQMAFGQVRRMPISNNEANGALRSKLISRGAE